MEFLADLWASLFAGDDPTPRNIQRMIKAVTQPHGEAAPRMEAAYKLASWGTPQAISALLRRFTIQTPSDTVDQDEKQEVCQLLIRLDRDALEPIFSYLETGDEASYLVEALAQILPADELIERVTEHLVRLEGTYTRTPKGKVALIDILSSHEDPRIPAPVLPFLPDPNDDVTFACIVCLTRPSYEQDVREGFLQLLVESSDRPRIQARLLEALAELKWPVTGYRRKLEGQLPEGFSFTSKGRVQVKGSRP